MGRKVDYLIAYRAPRGVYVVLGIVRPGFRVVVNAH